MASLSIGSSGVRARRIASSMVLMASLGACGATSDEEAFSGSGGSDPGGTTSGEGASSGLGGAGGDIGVGSSVGGSTGAGGECTQNVDIVFVMDVSTSMGAFLSKLAQEMPVVDGAVKALNLASTPHYGLVVFVDDTMISNNAQPYPDVTALQQDFQSWASFTSSNSQVSGGGYNSTWPENSLDALFEGATKFAWRPADQTLRIVIHTTDDTFWNGPTTQDGVAIVHNYQETVSALQQAQVRVFSFAALLGGPLENQDVSAGWFGPYQASPAIPEATGGDVFKLDEVLSGQISLSASINKAVSDSFCKPYPPPS